MLNARRTDEKYRGSYETSIMKRFAQFANSPHVDEDLEKLFTLIALNCALRNGDAHLKNFGIVYDDVLGRSTAGAGLRSGDDVRLPAQRQHGADAQRNHQMADAKELQRLGETRIGGTPAQVREILKRIAEAIAQHLG